MARPVVDAYLLQEHGPQFWLSAHFMLVEFASRDGADLVLVAPRLVEDLEKGRRQSEGALRVNSGFRTEAHNRRIGGKPKSRHMLGWASDLVSMTLSPPQFALLMHSINPHSGGIGCYTTFVHYDVRDGNPVRWIGRNHSIPVDQWVAELKAMGGAL